MQNYRSNRVTKAPDKTHVAHVVTEWDFLHVAALSIRRSGLVSYRELPAANGISAFHLITRTGR